MFSLGIAPSSILHNKKKDSLACRLALSNSQSCSVYNGIMRLFFYEVIVDEVEGLISNHLIEIESE